MGMRKIAQIGTGLGILILAASYQREDREIRRLENEDYIPQMYAPLHLRLTDENNIRCVTGFADSLSYPLLVREFYFGGEFKPVWTSFTGYSKNAAELFDLISNAAEYGLNPSDYHFDRLLQLRHQVGLGGANHTAVQCRTDAELLFTDAAFRLMIHLRSGYGTADTSLVSQLWHTQLPDALRRGLFEGGVCEAVCSVQPQFTEYVRLQRATSLFVRTTRLDSDDFRFDVGETDSLKLLVQTHEVLIRLGYLSDDAGLEDVPAALRVFQFHHGLNQDGKPGKNTRLALSMQPEMRFRLLVLNLDRLRKQNDMQNDLLYINIPAYTLKVYRKNRLVREHRVVVGHPSTPTPRLTSQLQRVITNPYWHVPRSITLNEILPKAKADSTYLKRNRFRVFDKSNQPLSSEALSQADLSQYTFRQDAGSDNALGRVKFVFPNPYSVYLHDTPSKALFEKDLRAFSHGCVRVQHPEELADYVARHLSDDETNIGEAIRKGRHHEVVPSGNLSIHIRYLTCEADEHGNIFFYKDIYGLDAVALKSTDRLLQ